MKLYKGFGYKITSEIVFEDDPKMAYSYRINAGAPFEYEDDDDIESGYWYHTKEIAEKEARAHIDKLESGDI